MVIRRVLLEALMRSLREVREEIESTPFRSPNDAYIFHDLFAKEGWCQQVIVAIVRYGRD